MIWLGFTHLFVENLFFLSIDFTYIYIKILQHDQLSDIMSEQLFVCACLDIWIQFGAIVNQA